MPALMPTRQTTSPLNSGSCACWQPSRLVTLTGIGTDDFCFATPACTAALICSCVGMEAAWRDKLANRVVAVRAMVVRRMAETRQKKEAHSSTFHKSRVSNSATRPSCWQAALALKAAGAGALLL